MLKHHGRYAGKIEISGLIDTNYSFLLILACSVYIFENGITLVVRTSRAYKRAPHLLSSVSFLIPDSPDCDLSLHHV